MGSFAIEMLSSSRSQYFTAICPLQPIFTERDDRWGRIYPAGGESLGGSAVTKSFIGGKCMQPGITVGAFTGTVLVAWKDLCFASHAHFHFSMLLAINTALHHHSRAWLHSLCSSSSVLAPRKRRRCPPWCQPLRFPAASAVALPDTVHHLRRSPPT